MPNTLAHVGVQVAISRALWRDAELRWISLGCVIPDLPWIAQRAITTLLPQIDPYEMRFYAVAQASLAVSLVACAGFALLSRRPRHLFLLLSVNAVLHLLLDALQTKWANGVHLFAPFSWTIWNAGWFWPESPWTWFLTALGLGAFAWLWRERPPVQVAPTPAIRRQRVLAVVRGDHVDLAVGDHPDRLVPARIPCRQIEVERRDLGDADVPIQFHGSVSRESDRADPSPPSH